ncbi:hypothetical protein GO730_02720 [Spirosoma sp. HMF3257]|nr:hypothetical protein [Spirosoma telluris]
MSKPKEILPIISQKDNPELTTAFNTYKSNRDWANILGVVGGFGVGYSLGGAIVGRKLSGGLLAGGAAILGVGLLVNGSANRSLQRVVQLFNGGSVSEVQIELFIKSEDYLNAVGVKFRF